MGYDVRAVRFIKTTEKKLEHAAQWSDDSFILGNKKADFICLGHFDMMHIDTANTILNNPLDWIQSDRTSGNESHFNCPENYVYSLYTLKSIQPDQHNALEDFWKMQTTFTVVTRVHCDYPKNWRSQDKQAFSKIIERHCCRLANAQSYNKTEKGSCIAVLKGLINRHTGAEIPVNCVFYDSLELGDTVSIMKSRSLAAILDVVRKISSNPCVQDTYSYCGIRRDLLQNKPLTFSEDIAVKDALLEHVSTRFSVKSNRYAEKFFSELPPTLKADQFYVTGTADRVIHWGTCPEWKLLQIMHAFTQLGNRMHLCFNDIITRVGIYQQKQPTKSISWPDNQLSDIFIRIRHLDVTVKWLRQEIKAENAASWKYTLLKLLGTLVSIYDSYVMDDLAELLIPGVDALLERIDYLRNQNNGLLPDEYSGEIIEFLTWLSSLTNDISQLESQLTQHPELSPVRYYIPSMLLQFESRFVMKACSVLSDDGKRHFRPMLVPTGQNDLYTICPLDPRQEPYSGKCPLLVFIPIRDLYRPWEVAHRITHEIAHYCEDVSRNRQIRHEILQECASRTLTNIWYTEHVLSIFEDNDQNLYKKSVAYSQRIRTVLNESIELIHKNPTEWYLSQSIEGITRGIVSLVSSIQSLERYLYSLSENCFYEQQTAISNSWIESEIITSNAVISDYISKHMQYLGFFCAECYADIAMIILLGCDFEEYYHCVFHDEFLQLQKNYDGVDTPPLRVGVMIHIQRMVLVIQTMIGQNKWNLDDIASQPYPWVEFAVDEIKYQRQRKVNILDYPELLTPEEKQLLISYLTACTVDLARKIDCNSILNRLFPFTNSEQTEVKKLREIAQCVKHSQFDWEALQKFLIMDENLA